MKTVFSYLMSLQEIEITRAFRNEHASSYPLFLCLFVSLCDLKMPLELWQVCWGDKNATQSTTFAAKFCNP